MSATRAELVERTRDAIERLLGAPAGSTARGEPDESQPPEADEEEVAAGPSEVPSFAELRAAVDRLVAGAVSDGLELDPAELGALRDELQRLADGALVRVGQNVEG